METAKKLQAGDRLYYTGDIANSPDRLTIERVDATHYWVRFDEEPDRLTAIHHAAVGPYSGTCNPRFSPLADVEAWRSARIRALHESVAARA